MLQPSACAYGFLYWVKKLKANNYTYLSLRVNINRYGIFLNNQNSILFTHSPVK